MRKKLSMNPRVSVIIPTYNCEFYITEAIKSILQQTYNAYEIIVIDDGSTDNTRQVLKPYMERIHYIYQGNQGVSAARNRGIKEAKGELISFLDADDFWILPTKLEEQATCFEQQPDVGIVQSGWRFVNQWGEKILDKEPWQDAERLNLQAWLVWGHVLPSSIMIRKEWLDRVGGFDPQFSHGEDMDMVLRIALLGCKSAWFKKITTCYRQHSENATKRLRKQAVSMSAVWDKFFSRSELPNDISHLEFKVRYYNLIWLAFLFYEAKNFLEMSENLRRSLNYKQFSTTPETIANWIHYFKQATAKYTDKVFNIHELTSLAEWQELIQDIYLINSKDKPKLITPVYDKNLQCNYPYKINLNEFLSVNSLTHRSGWHYVVRSLQCLHNNSGVWVEHFVENNFCWSIKEPLQKPWIGFMHNPQSMPSWFKYNQSPQALFSSKLWQESAPFCQGLFCFSLYHKYWLQKHIKLDIKIVNLIHPSETPSIKFSMQNFLNNPYKKVVQVGWWLRKLHSIYYLPVTHLKKARIKVNKSYINEMFEIELNKYAIRPKLNEVEIINCLPDAEYDELLSQNIVYLDLYDSSANNAIIECIVRNTPILVNPLPAVKEYLGEDYPFYFESRSEAARKAEDFSLVEATHQYLKEHPIKEKLTANYFLKSVAESTIYQNLCL